MNRIRKNRVVTFILVIMLFFLISLIFIVNLFHMNYCMNADIASDGILARLIWETKEWVPKTWYISTETRIIFTTNLAALFYGITHNMQLSLGLACSAMTILILYSIVYSTGVSSPNINNRLTILLAVFLLPSSIISLELLYLFASYYAIHVVILFFTLGTFAKLCQEGKVIKPIEIIFSLLFAFILGLQGTRGLLVIYGPIFAISILKAVYTKYSHSTFSSKRSLITVIWCFTLLIVSFAGTLFPFSTGQNISRNIRKGFHKLITVVMPDISKAVGLEYLNVPGKICLLFLLCILIYYFVNIIYKFISKKAICSVEWIYLVLCTSPILTALMISFTTVDSSERYYFLFIFAMAWCILLIKPKQIIIKCVAIFCIFTIGLINIKNIYYPIIMQDHTKQTAYYQVAKYLEDNGYQTAYSTFDHANYITMLSNGRIGVYAIDSFEKMNICKWLTSTKWYPPNKPANELTAYVVTEAREAEMRQFIQTHPNTMRKVTQIEGINIYESPYNFSNLGD